MINTGGLPSGAREPGENLLLQSDVEQKGSGYSVAAYSSSIEELTVGEYYTVTYCVTPAEGVEKLSFHKNGSNGVCCFLNVSGTSKQIVSNTFLCTKDLTEGAKAGMHPQAFRMPNDGTVTGETIIHWAKIERGINGNPIWTPSPYDSSPILTALDRIPEMHRNIFRGRNLGESTQMSDAHKASIADGSFQDLWVGDYWTHGGINYRIADMDYWWRCGDTQDLQIHHLVIVPDTTALCNGTAAVMEDTNTTANGYTNSKMRIHTLPEVVKPKIEAAFPDLLLTHRDIFTTKAENGVPTAEAWTNSDVELMNEVMVYGTTLFTPMGNGVLNPRNYTTGNSQLALFRLNPNYIKIRQNYWLRDIASATGFALVNGSGHAFWTIASSSYLGVRPVFCIGVQQNIADPPEDQPSIR